MLVRTIGLIRAKAKIGMKNLAYNMRRLVQLRRINPSPAWTHRSGNLRARPTQSSG
jgi:hypothetical protein